MSTSFPILPADTRESTQIASVAGQTHFPFGFPIQRPADLAVFRTLAGGAETLLALGADYSIEGVGAPSGGTAVLTAGVAIGTVIRSLGLAEPGRQTNITAGGYYDPAALEAELDRAALRDVERRRDIGKTNTRIDNIDGAAAEAATQVSLAVQADVTAKNTQAQQAAAVATSKAAETLAAAAVLGTPKITAIEPTPVGGKIGDATPLLRGKAFPASRVDVIVTEVGGTGPVVDGSTRANAAGEWSYTLQSALTAGLDYLLEIASMPISDAWTVAVDSVPWLIKAPNDVAPIWAIDVGQGYGWYDGDDYTLAGLIAATPGGTSLGSNAYVIGPYIDTSTDYATNGDFASGTTNFTGANGAAVANVAGELEITHVNTYLSGFRMFALTGSSWYAQPVVMSYSGRKADGSVTGVLEARISAQAGLGTAYTGGQITGTGNATVQVEGAIEWLPGVTQSLYVGGATLNSDQGGKKHIVDNVHVYKAAAIKGQVRGEHSFRVAGRGGPASGVAEALWAEDCNLNFMPRLRVFRSAAGDLTLAETDTAGNTTTINCGALAEGQDFELFFGNRADSANDEKSFFVYRDGILKNGQLNWSGRGYTRARLHVNTGNVNPWGGDRSKTQVQVWGAAQDRLFGRFASSMAQGLNRILVAGDSGSAWTLGVNFPVLVEAAAGRITFGAGVGSSTLAQQLARVQSLGFMKGLPLIHFDLADNGWVNEDTTYGLYMQLADNREGKIVICQTNARNATERDRHNSLYTRLVAQLGTGRVIKTYELFAALSNGSAPDAAAVAGGWCPPSCIDNSDGAGVHLKLAPGTLLANTAAAKILAL
ncbi:Ig-like domain-containing protein [Ancylobacter terrae]|uniref:hypothetical protein n=1 Tax=Ancylobacter sp. sgz301288 TaxID=3342077 RepID=UPI0038585A73